MPQSNIAGLHQPAAGYGTTPCLTRNYPAMEKYGPLWTSHDVELCEFQALATHWPGVRSIGEDAQPILHAQHAASIVIIRAVLGF